jgi:hypothetical protein
LSSPIDAAKIPAQAPAQSPTQPPTQAPTNAAPIADRADIRPLDIGAALQILLAEVRAAFALQAIATDSNTSPNEAPTSPPQAARALLQMLLAAMPDKSAGMPAWSTVLARVESALQTGLDRGIYAVTVWRDVPPSIVDAAKQTRTLVFSTLGDEQENLAWLRPEWAGLGTEIERFWRRRRLARRLLTDPDYSPGRLNDESEPRA